MLFGTDVSTARVTMWIFFSRIIQHPNNFNWENGFPLPSIWNQVIKASKILHLSPFKQDKNTIYFLNYHSWVYFQPVVILEPITFLKRVPKLHWHNLIQEEEIHILTKWLWLWKLPIQTIKKILLGNKTRHNVCNRNFPKVKRNLNLRY